MQVFVLHMIYMKARQDDLEKGQGEGMLNNQIIKKTQTMSGF